MSKEEKLVVSACLAGIECRYDCAHKKRDYIKDLVDSNIAIAVCPEELGGLPTPRDPAEKINQKIISIKGKDITLAYQTGAQKALELAQKFGATRALLKSKSPMCGSDLIYDGSFSGNLTDGDGVFASLLKKYNILVESID